MVQHQKRGSFAKRIQHQKTKSGLISQVLLYTGLFIILFSMLYLIINQTNYDSIISSWLLFMIGGGVMVAVSQIIRYTGLTGHANRNRKKK